MKQEEHLISHDALEKRPNIRIELRRIRRDPLEPLVHALEKGKRGLLSNERTRYSDAYYSYYLSFERFLPEMSLAARFSKGPYWVRRTGGSYTRSQRKLAKKYNSVERFLEFDLINCIIHSRILLDRVASLSRSFLMRPPLPSFTSFSDHKKFFSKLKSPYGKHETHAGYVRSKTEWFDVLLKEVRDKFVVHAAPCHMRFLGYVSDSPDLSLTIVVPHSEETGKLKVISVSPLQLSHDIEKFLKWFCRYALSAIREA